MRAVVHTKYGPPDVLELRDVPKPAPADNEVLIKVHATTVTAADYRVRGSNFPRMFWLPARAGFGLLRPRKTILGSNLAGEVEAVGRGVTRFKAGDQVFGSTGGQFGAYAEYVCVPETATFTIKPSNVTYAEAASIPFGAFTALFFLRDKGNIRSGQRVLIYGASGSVGTAAVQLARYYGTHVTGVCSTTNLELVESLGANRVIDYTREDFTQEGQTYDLIFETVGKSSVARGLDSLAENGIYLANVIDPAVLVQMLKTSVAGSKKIASGRATEKLEDLVFMKELVEAGALKAVIDRSYPLERTAEAHRYADKGHKKGNVVITVDHSD